MNALLGVIAIPVSYHYGLLTNVQLWATIKALSVIYIALLVATAVFNFIRSPLRMLAEHHRHFANLADAGIAGDGTIYKGNPDIEYTDFEIVERWLGDESGLTDEKPDDEWGKADKVRVILARFYYKPHRDVPPFLYVKAHIAIADSEGMPIKTRYDAVWDKERESEYKRFETTDSYKLIVAVLPCDLELEPGIVTFQHGERDGEFCPELILLDGKEFQLQLDLIGKHQNIPILNKWFTFSLSLDQQPALKLQQVVTEAF